MTVHALADWINIVGGVATPVVVVVSYWRSKRHRAAEHHQTRLAMADERQRQGAGR